MISACDEILDVTIEGDQQRVAELIEMAHETYTSILKYNDENALSCAITMAYFTAPAYYNVVRELPSGKGFADILLHRRTTTSFGSVLLARDMPTLFSCQEKMQEPDRLW